MLRREETGGGGVGEREEGVCGGGKLGREGGGKLGREGRNGQHRKRIMRKRESKIIII